MSNRLLVIALILLILAGCGGSSDKDGMATKQDDRESHEENKITRESDSKKTDKVDSAKKEELGDVSLILQPNPDAICINDLFGGTFKGYDSDINFKGKTLDQWLEQLAGIKKDKSDEAKQALIEMGAQAVPGLIRTERRNEDNGRLFDSVILKIGAAAVHGILYTPEDPFRLYSGFDRGLMSYRYNPEGLLYQIGKPAVPELLKELKSGSPRAQQIALTALSYMNEKSLAPILAEQLENANNSDSIGKIRLLGRFDSKLASSYLVKLFKSNDARTRKDAIYAFRDVHDKTVLPVIIKLMFEEKEDISWTVGEVLSAYRKDNEEAIAMLIKALKHADPEIRERAAFVLKDAGKEALPALIEATKDENANVRTCALLALRHIPDKSAIPAIIERLKDEDSSARSNAMHALCLINEKDVVPALLVAMQDEKACAKAIWVLGELGAKEAVPHLLKAMQDKNETIRYSAISALSKIPCNERIDILTKTLFDKNENVRYEAALKLRGLLVKSTAPFLLKALKDESGNVQHEAAHAISKMADNSMLPVLLETLKADDNSSDVKAYMCDALALIKDKKALPALYEKLKDTSSSVRRAAVRAVGEICNKDTSAIPFIAELLKDEDESVRYSAVRALGEINDKAAIGKIVETLNDDKVDVREIAVKALELIGDKSAIPLLIKAMNDSAFNVRQAASHALEVFGDETALPVLIKTVEDEYENILTRQNAIGAIQRIGGKKFVPLIIKVLESKDSSIYFAAARALGEIGDKSAIPFLIKGLERDTCVCAEALGKIGDKSAVPALIKHLDDKGEYVRKAVVKGLIAIGGDSAASELLKFLANRKDDFDSRMHIINYFCEIDYLPMIPVLIEMLNDDDLSGNALFILSSTFKQNFGKDSAKWREWWEANKERILKEEAEKE